MIDVSTITPERLAYARALCEAEPRYITEINKALCINPGKAETFDDLVQIFSSPIHWAEAMLLDFSTYKPFVCNYVQRTVLERSGRLNVIRVHRRGGKSWTLAIMALFEACTKPGSKTLVLAPDSPKVGVVFEVIRNFLATNPSIAESVVRNVQNPHEIVFTNGSFIRGFTTATRSGGNGSIIRGQAADLVILDECCFFEEGDYQSFMPIIIGDANREPVTVFAASTTKGNRGRFFDWDTKPELGWTSIWIPVTENPEMSAEKIEQARLQHTEMEWIFEWLVEWGTIEGGVVDPKYIDAARDEYTYVDLTSTPYPRAIGVDWDKYQWGCEIVCVELGPDGVYKVIHRETIPKSEYTLTNAVNRVIELNKCLTPEFIYVDRGYGETNVELLKKHGKEHKESGLAKKVKGITFDKGVDVIDPVSGEKIRKHFKEVMVNRWCKLFEDGKITIKSDDKLLYTQLKNYRVKKVSQSHVIYTDKDEHSVDAFGLAIYALYEKYGNVVGFTPATRKIGFVAMKSGEVSQRGKSADPTLSQKIPAKHDAVRAFLLDEELPVTRGFSFGSRRGVKEFTRTSL